MDDIKLNWIITQLDSYPQYQGYKDCVFNVHWDLLSYYSGVGGDAYYGRVYSVSDVSLASGDFTAYSDLKNDQVLNWVWDAMGTGSKLNFENAAKQKITDQISPPVVVLPLPW